MSDLQSDAIFGAIKDRVAADPAKAKTVNGVFVYKITKDGTVKKEWSKISFLDCRVQSSIICFYCLIEIHFINKHLAVRIIRRKGITLREFF